MCAGETALYIREKGGGQEKKEKIIYSSKVPTLLQKRLF